MICHDFHYILVIYSNEIFKIFFGMICYPHETTFYRMTEKVIGNYIYSPMNDDARKWEGTNGFSGTRVSSL